MNRIHAHIQNVPAAEARIGAVLGVISIDDQGVSGGRLPS